MLYINMKNYKNIACTDFVNINIALNLYPYEGHLGFILELIKKMYLLCSLNIKSETLIYDHITIVLVLCTQHKTLLSSIFTKR